jgi:hypothetical protein
VRSTAPSFHVDRIICDRLRHPSWALSTTYGYNGTSPRHAPNLSFELITLYVIDRVVLPAFSATSNSQRLHGASALNCRRSSLLLLPADPIRAIDCVVLPAFSATSNSQRLHGASALNCRRSSTCRPHPCDRLRRRCWTLSTAYGYNGTSPRHAPDLSFESTALYVIDCVVLPAFSATSNSQRLHGASALNCRRSSLLGLPADPIRAIDDAILPCRLHICDRLRRPCWFLLPPICVYYGTSRRHPQDHSSRPHYT